MIFSNHFETAPFRCLFTEILDGTKILIAVAEIPICQVQVGVLCHCHAAVSQNPAEGVNIHAIHQTSLGKVIPQRMRRVGLVNPSPSQISLEPRFKGMDLQWQP